MARTCCDTLLSTIQWGLTTKTLKDFCKHTKIHSLCTARTFPRAKLKSSQLSFNFFRVGYTFKFLACLNQITKSRPLPPVHLFPGGSALIRVHIFFDELFTIANNLPLQLCLLTFNIVVIITVLWWFSSEFSMEQAKEHADCPIEQNITRNDSVLFYKALYNNQMHLFLSYYSVQ